MLVVRTAAVLTGIAAVVGCPAPPEEAAPRPVVTRAPAVEPAGPEPSASSVLDWLQRERFHERWERWPADSLLLRPAGDSAHGAFVATYASPVALAALERGERVPPKGSLLVVEEYLADTTLVGIAVMARTDPGRREDGGWFFVSLGSAGEVGPQETERCAGCHVREPDRVFGAELGTPWPIDSTGARPAPADTQATAAR